MAARTESYGGWSESPAMVVVCPVPSNVDQATTGLVGFGFATQRNSSC